MPQPSSGSWDTFGVEECFISKWKKKQLSAEKLWCTRFWVKVPQAWTRVTDQQNMADSQQTAVVPAWFESQVFSWFLWKTFFFQIVRFLRIVDTEESFGLLFEWRGYDCRSERLGFSSHQVQRISCHWDRSVRHTLTLIAWDTAHPIALVSGTVSDTTRTMG